MHVLVTGAGGFVGRALVQRLLEQPDALGRRIARLSLLDRSVDGLAAADAVVRRHVGDFGDAGVLDEVLDEPVDLAFHLASVPGSLAERDDALGWQVNLLGTLALVRRLSQQAGRPSAQRQAQRQAQPPAQRSAQPLAQRLAQLPGHPPPQQLPPPPPDTPRATRLVFASSVAVYGALGPGSAHEDSVPRPALSYGAHKLMTELLLADLSRRGELDAISLRLPGIVPRPPADSGHGSAFMSQLFHRIGAGEPYRCPVSADATAWWMSLRCCIDNLLHAARLPAHGLPAMRCFQLPVLQASVQSVVQALARKHGSVALSERIQWVPDERIEALFGRLPPLLTPRALAAGFKPDADTDALVLAA